MAGYATCAHLVGTIPAMIDSAKDGYLLARAMFGMPRQVSPSFPRRIAIPHASPYRKFPASAKLPRNPRNVPSPAPACHPESL